MTDTVTDTVTDTEGFVELQEELAKPPQPPSIKKRFEFTKAQLIGVPVILLIPILALIGLFDAHFEHATSVAGDLQVTVEYPSSIRYKKLEPISINVQNLSAVTFPTVTVTIDDAYLNAFSTVTFTPDVDEVTADKFILNLNNLQPQESRRILVEVQAEHYWNHTGNVNAEYEETHVGVTISTFIFP